MLNQNVQKFCKPRVSAQRFWCGSGKIQRFSLGGRIGGRFFFTGDEARTYLWREDAGYIYTLGVRTPPGAKVYAQAMNGDESYPDSQGNLEITLDETWDRRYAFLIGLDPLVSGVSRVISIKGAQPFFYTPFVRKWQISTLIPDGGNLERIEYPAHQDDIGFTARQMAQDYADLHNDLLSKIEGNPFIFFRTHFSISQDSRLKAYLGYDGPVKVWVDGTLLYHDPDGTNPAFVKAEQDFFASKGQHEILIAFSSNCGQAWGIMTKLFWWLEKPVDVELVGNITPPQIEINI